MNELKRYKIVSLKNNKLHITSNFLIGEYFDVLIDIENISNEEEFEYQIERIIDEKILSLFFEKRIGNTIPYFFIPKKNEIDERDEYDVLIDIISLNDITGNLELRIRPSKPIKDKKYDISIYNIKDFLNYGVSIEDRIVKICESKIIEVLAEKPETEKPETEKPKGYKINFL
jgi:SHS2 domain-containing protein